MRKPDDIVCGLLKKAGRKGSAEVFYAQTAVNEVSFESGKLKNIESKHLQGISLRLISEGKIGFSSTSDMTRTEDVLSSAVDSSKFAKKVGFEFPGEGSFPETEIFDQSVESYAPSSAVEEGEKAIEMLSQDCPKGIADISLISRINSIRIVNTSGLDVFYRSTSFSHFASVTIVEGDSILMIGDGGEYRDLQLNTEKYVAKISDLAKKAEEKTVCSTGKYPVIFVAEELHNLLSAFEMGLDGRHMLKGDSPLIGREGERVLGNITITDDPLVPYGIGSRPFDDEGVLSERTVLFDDGVFRNFLFDLDTASETGRKSTGSASRGLMSLPSISSSNLFVAPGDVSLGEMLKETEETIIVYGAIGGGQSNLLAGDFALNLMLGFLVKNGEFQGRLENAMVSGNVYDAFGPGVRPCSEVRQTGHLFAPDIFFPELSISCR